MIAEGYGVPEAQAVARILRIQRERGPEVADEYLREARRLSRQVLAERQRVARRDRLAHTVVSVGLLLSILRYRPTMSRTFSISGGRWTT